MTRFARAGRWWLVVCLLAGLLPAGAVADPPAVTTGAESASYTPLSAVAPWTPLDRAVPKLAGPDGGPRAAAGGEACGCLADQGCCPSGGCCRSTHPHTCPEGDSCYVMSGDAEAECGEAREVCIPPE